MASHRAYGLQAGGLRGNRDGVGLHDGADPVLLALQPLTAERLQHRAVGDQAHQAAPVVLYRHVPHPLPVHDVGDQVDRVLGMDGEQLHAHVLFHALIVRPPVPGFLRFRQRPAVPGAALLLVPVGGRGHGHQRAAFEAVATHLGAGLQQPVGPRLPALHPLPDHLQEAFDVVAVDPAVA